jgi:cell division protein ZapA
MSQAPIALQIGGQTYRVRAQASEQDLQRLAATIDQRLKDLTRKSRFAQSPQNLLLVAISLAHDLEHERALRRTIEREANEMLQLLLEQLDQSLTAADTALAQLQPRTPDNDAL